MQEVQLLERQYTTILLYGVIWKVNELAAW